MTSGAGTRSLRVNGAGKRKRPILIVDDDALMCKGFSHYVEVRGWPSRVAMTVTAALEAVRSGERFAAMICDGRVGERSGIVVIRAAHDVRPDLPILALTGYWDDHEFVNEAQALGAEYVQKPANIGSFLARVATRHHLHDDGLIRRVDQVGRRYGLGLRATEVLALVVADCSYATIADELCLSVDTVREYVREIKRKSKMSAGELACLVRSSLKEDRQVDH